MRTSGWIGHLSLGLALGCSSDPVTQGPAIGRTDPSLAGSAGGTSVGSGGVPGTSGGTQATGGIISSAGGIPATTGGTSATGGALATGGTSPTGGTPGMTGGTPGTGGSPATGGTSMGTGGFMPAGGTGGALQGGQVGMTGGSGGTAAGGGGSGGMAGSADPFLVCMGCHGPEGQGIPMLGPEIQHPVRDFATWVVRNGRTGHPDFPTSEMEAFSTTELSDADLNAILDRLSAMPKPTTGEGMFLDYCGNCHGATGVGGPAGHNARGESYSKALQMVRGGHSPGQFSMRTGYMPLWSTGDLSDADVQAIVSYLDSL